MWLLIKMGLNRTCLAVAFSIRIFLVACGGGMNVCILYGEKYICWILIS